MMLNLLAITEEEIKNSAQRACEETNTSIMYLQNTGTENFRWNIADFIYWLGCDIEK